MGREQIQKKLLKITKTIQIKIWHANWPSHHVNNITLNHLKGSREPQQLRLALGKQKL